MKRQYTISKHDLGIVNIADSNTECKQILAFDPVDFNEQSCSSINIFAAPPTKKQKLTSKNNFTVKLSTYALDSLLFLFCFVFESYFF